MDPPDGLPERAGRALGRAVFRGRAIARQLGDPAVQERFLATGRSAAARHGPEVVERAAQRATDRALWGIAYSGSAVLTGGGIPGSGVGALVDHVTSGAAPGM